MEVPADRAAQLSGRARATRACDDRRSAMNDSTNLGVGRQFLRDLIIVVLLLREVRNRVVARLFGYPRMRRC